MTSLAAINSNRTSRQALFETKSMFSSDPTRRLRDILENIARIRSHMQGIAAQQLVADRKTQDAVERCLERICEAARKLGDSLDAKYPEVEFAKLRQLGSVLRHDYDDIDTDMLWRSVTERLDPLEHACRRELADAPK
ncbi:MAG TPA: HepT-like ribonuclease domain-containing protein [Candidatus Binataceae bacterium]|nr:HepT-like ribonuclease domain-containing protein [Candidatus Binataceae bacterium]